jgi:hypothetical protein
MEQNIPAAPVRNDASIGVDRPTQLFQTLFIGAIVSSVHIVGLNAPWNGLFA